MTADIREEMLMVLEQRFGVSRVGITDESLLREDLDLDSIDLFDIIGVIEKKTGVSADLSDFIHAKTFGDFLKVLESLTAKAAVA